MIQRLRGMISCEEALEHLRELIDGELAQEDEVAVRWHVEVCSRCYPRYDFQRAYLALLRRIRRGEGPSLDLRQRLARLIPGAPREGHDPASERDTDTKEE
ncbi:MAG: zf-HC2 domain-containing protein [Gemmatimonadota bacterium]